MYVLICMMDPVSSIFIGGGGWRIF